MVTRVHKESSAQEGIRTCQFLLSNTLIKGNSNDTKTRGGREGKLLFLKKN